MLVNSDLYTSTVIGRDVMSIITSLLHLLFLIITVR